MQIQDPDKAAVLGPASELADALVKAGQARNTGKVTPQELDAFLLDRYGMTYKGMAAAVKAMPQELPKKNWSERDLRKAFVKAQAYGVTGGWSDEIAGLIGVLKGTGYAKARKEALAEMKAFEKDFPWLARAAKANGLAVGALAGGLAARGAIAVGAGRGVSAATLAGSDAPVLGAAGRAIAGGAVGANAGAGGMLGEASGMDRLPNAATGAALGAGTGALAHASQPSKLAKIIGLMGAGAGAGAVGKKLLNYLKP